MRILCVTPWFPEDPGAQTGSFIYQSVKSLVKCGHQVTVLVTKPWRPGIAARIHPDWKQTRIDFSAFEDLIELEVMHHLSIPRGHLRKLSNSLYLKSVSPKITAFLQNSHYDVIHAHTELAGAAAVKSGKQQGCPVVITLHGVNTHPRFNTSSQKSMVGKSLREANRVVLVGESLRDHFLEIATSDENFSVVHNGFRLPEIVPGQVDKNWGDPIRFISVSNLHEGKGIDINLQAMAKMNQAGYSAWHYSIVGGGRERANLEKLADELGISSKVSFIGRCRWEDVFDYLVRSDVFTLPSYREAFGIVYLESMGCGLLTIGVEGQGPSAFIKHGESGLLVKPRSVESLANQLQRCFTNQEEMTKIARAGRDFALREMTWSNHAERLSALYQEVISDAA